MEVIDHAFFCKRPKLKTAEMSSFLGLTKKKSGHFGRFQFCQCLHPFQWSFYFESIDMLLCTVCCCNSQFWCSATEIRIFYLLRSPPWWFIRMRVRLVIRRLRVRPSRVGNILSRRLVMKDLLLSFFDSRRAVVSVWRKNVHNTG